MKIGWQVRRTVGAFGLAGVVCEPLVRGQLSSSHLFVYQSADGGRSVLFATLILFSLTWLFIGALFAVAARHRGFSRFLWSTIAILLPLALLVSWSELLSGVLPVGAVVRCVLGAYIVVWLVRILTQGRRLHGRLLLLRGPLSVLLMFLACSTGLGLSELLWNAWLARHLDTASPLHVPAAAVAATPRHRIVWIVLDELSYRHTYADRRPGIGLPAFDALASQSTLFTDVRPVGDRTGVILPSLFLGTRFESIRSSADGRALLYRTAAGQPWHVFDPAQTVFQKALDSGYSTGVVGWFNPYCRILAPVLDHCFWVFRSNAVAGQMTTDAALLSNLLAPARTLLLAAARRFHLPVAPTEAEVDAPLHISDYRDLFQAGDRLLADRSCNFLLLHMPVPHPWGIYDRKTGQFASRNSSYRDNLALADRYLDHVMQVLARQGEWDDATVIVMGDHSLRPTWDGTSGWTQEDIDLAQSNGFDDRPALAIKLPRQHEAAHIDAAFDESKLRVLLEQMLAGGIRQPAELQAVSSGMASR